MTRHTVPFAFPAADHNHGSCETALLDRAVALFEGNNMKLTELRRRVLEEIAGSHQALGAYEILERLSAKGNGPRLAPISVYRAIDALHSVGLVHRLESRNAFFACHNEHASAGDRVFLACTNCKQVAEIAGEQVFSALRALIDKADFEVGSIMTEVSGTCATCRDSVR